MPSPLEGSLHLTTILPSKILAPYIRYYRVVHTGGTGGVARSPHLVAGFPDGNVELVLSFGEFGRRSVNHADHYDPVKSQAWVVGPGLQTSVMELSGEVDVLNVCFLPGGAHAFFRPALSETLNHWVDLEDLWKPRAMRVLAGLEGLSTVQRVAQLECLLARRLNERSAARDRDNTGSTDLGYILEAIDLTHGRLPVRELMRSFSGSLSASERTLSRLFRERVGLSSKQYSRLVRFGRARELLRITPDPGEVANAAGYYDQAHLTNEFTTLCGLSPTALLDTWPFGEFFQDA